MYEFLYGVPPFNDESAEKVFANITSRRIFFPPDDDEMQTSPEARDLMERLMCLDARRRLGAHGTDEIKRHPFFAGLDWESLMTTPGPFVPQPTEEVSTDYFDARGLTDLPDELNPTLASVNPSAATADDPVIAALADDFGAFNFRNLSASKAANDEVLTKISAWPASSHLRS
jgi:serine/threonine-protein kinase RIM15